MRRLIWIVTLSALIAGSGACTWSTKESVDSVTWSDDDSAHAFIRMRWQQRTAYQILETVTERRNYEHRLYVQDSDGGGQRALIDFRSGRPSPELYYMKSQGYLVYGAVDVGSDMTLRRIDLQGNERSIIRSDAAYTPCGALSAVPSPDGGTLAVLERRLAPGAYAPPSPPPPDDHAQCQDVITTVKLLNAATLSSQGEWTWEADGFTEYGWLSDNAFYVQAVNTSWRIDPLAGPQPVAQPDCLSPKTSSSRVSSTGASILPGTDTDTPVVAGGGAQPFGSCGS